MNRPTFQYELKNEADTHWYYIDSSENVLLSPYPKYLDDLLDWGGEGNEAMSPLDWRETKIGISRNEKYMGLFTSFGVPLSFTYAGAIILRHVHNTEGGEGIIRLVINVQTDDLTYEVFYKCEVDLSQKQNVFDKDNKYCQVELSEDSLTADLKNKEDTPCEIPLDGDAINVNHNGLTLQLAYSWTGGVPGTGAVYGNHIPGQSRDPIPDMGNSSVESNAYFQGLFFPSMQQSAMDYSNPANYILYISGAIQGGVPARLNLDYDFDVEENALTIPKQVSIVLQEFQFLPNGLNNSNTITLFTSPPTTFSGSPVNFKGSISNLNVVLQRDRSYRVEIIVAPQTGGAVFSYRIYNLRLTMKASATLPATTYKAFTYFTFLNKLFKKVLGNHVSVVSDFFTTNQYINDNNAMWTTVTSGEALRNSVNPKIKTSIQQAFNDMRKWMIGMSVEGSIVRLEPLPYFFNKDLVIERLQATTIKDYEANDMGCNGIKTGYNSQVYDELNGREDFMGTTDWYYPLKRNQQNLDLSSPYYASPWAIEYARTYGIVKKDTTDSQYDEKTYLVEVNPTPVNGQYILKRFSGAVTGLTAPNSMYNWGLSNATAIWHNAARWLAMGYGRPYNEPRFLTFQQNNKNSNVGRHFPGSRVIVENANIGIPQFADAATALWKPRIVEAMCEVSYSLIERLRQPDGTRNGVLEVIHPDNGEIIPIFILDIGYYPETRDQYLIRGLCSPDADLTVL